MPHHEIGRLRHGVGVGAVELDADGTLGLREVGPIVHALDASTESLRREELRHDHVGPEPTTEQPEGRLRHPSHRSQEQRNSRGDRIGEPHGTREPNGLRRERQPHAGGFDSALRARLRFAPQPVTASCGCSTSSHPTPSSSRWRPRPKTTSSRN